MTKQCPQLAAGLFIFTDKYEMTTLKISAMPCLFSITTMLAGNDIVCAVYARFI